jgi:hypothetical protein
MRGNISVLLFIFLIGKFLPSSSQEIFPLIHRPQVYLDKRTQGAQTASLQGGIGTTAAFFAQVSIGTPPQLFEVQIDTGSSDFLVYGSSCVSTGCTNGAVNRYDMSASSTSQAITCTDPKFFCRSCVNFGGISNSCSFSDSYGGGGNPQGSLISDVFHIGQFPAVTISFGYINTVSGNFESAPASGIWGLAYQTLGVGVPALDTMVNQLQIPNMFSLCLGNSPVMTTGVDFTSNTNFKWTNIITRSYYTVEMLDMQVHSKSLGLPSSAYSSQFCAIDSGTTNILLPTLAFNTFYAKLKAMCNTTNLVGLCGVPSYEPDIFHGYCYFMSSYQRTLYPDIQIFLGNISTPLTITSQQYIYETQGYYCAGIGASSDNGPTVLGDIFMQNFHVAFDRVNNRVGFADPSTCPTAGELTQPNPAL